MPWQRTQAQSVNLPTIPVAAHRACDKDGDGLINVGQIKKAVSLANRGVITESRSKFLAGKFGKAKHEHVNITEFRALLAYLSHGHRVQDELAAAWARVEALEASACSPTTAAATVAVTAHDDRLPSPNKPRAARFADDPGKEIDHDKAPAVVSADEERSMQRSSYDELQHTESAQPWTAEGWVSSLRAVDPIVAKALVGGAKDELAALRALGASADKETLSRRLGEANINGALADVLLPQLQALAAPAAAAGDVGLQAKFAEGAAFDLKYGDLSTFFRGLEGKIGAPDPKVDEAMEIGRAHV